MKIIELIGYEASLKEELQLKLGTDGSYGIEQLLILPGEGWAGLVITATFHSPGGSAVQLLVPQDGVVDVPPEATDAAGRVAHGSIVFAGTADGVQRISCDMPYWVAVHSGVEGSESQQPTPAFVQQALTEIRASCEAVEQAEKRIEQMEGSVPIRLGQLTNDCGFITTAVSDLEHYYKKSETYTQAEVDALLSRIPHFEVAVVTALPTTDISSTTVYLVPSGGTGTDLYTEYLYVSGKWETLGTQTLSLEDYATVAWVNSLLQSYPLRTEIPVQSVNGKTGQVILSAADVDALGLGAQAADSAKLGGKAPAYYTAPVNLLDNSDFTDPINQRGQTGYNGNGYTIDRWRIGNSYSTVTVSDGSVGLAASGGSCFFRQLSEIRAPMRGKTYTLAICDASGNVYAGHATINAAAPSSNATLATISIATGMRAYLIENTDGTLETRVSISDGYSIELAWAALYEGRYTVDELPSYHPKGYAHELLECQRYFFKASSYLAHPGYKSTALYCFVNLPTQMVAVPAVTAASITVYHATGRSTTAAFSTVTTSHGNAVRISMVDDGLENYQQATVVTTGLELSADL